MGLESPGDQGDLISDKTTRSAVAKLPRQMPPTARSSLWNSCLLSLVGMAIAGLTSDCGPAEPSAEQGAQLYGKYCALCHGASGEGYRADDATALRNPRFLSLASDTFIEGSIARGRPGTTMSAWSVERGGPLDDAGIKAIVAYLRRLAAHTREDPSGLVVRGDAASGAKSYAARCESCHGRSGVGGRYVNLGNPELLAIASDGFLLRSLEQGRPGTPMPAYEGQLSPTEGADLVALMRSWQRPPDGALPLPPRPGQLGAVVLNPGATNAEFPGIDRFVPADTVKAAMDRALRLVVLDARPPSDYSRAHVAGAISAPFYEVMEYAGQIPKDVTVVAYCGCPHAESGQAVDTLKRLGYPRAYVLDEGFGVWRERGYPVRGGANP